MSKRVKIRVKRPWISYPGSIIQSNYGESLDHGYLLWDVKSAYEFDVAFHKLPNPHPFVTLDWQGTVAKTLHEAKKFPQQSRFRIRSDQQLAQKDMKQLSNDLRRAQSAIEVTYKYDVEVQKDVIKSAGVTLHKDDLRKLDVQLKLMRRYCSDQKLSAAQWKALEDKVRQYLSGASQLEDVARNTKWTIKELSFDNLFTYGSDNHVAFERMSGITGIFGANRVGKSSIVGVLMYALFNSTDRGAIKNVHVVNARHDHGLSRVRIGVDGCDYTIERQTAKHEKKGGGEHGVTSLNLYKHAPDGSLIEQNGDVRTDTEKVIRRLIGTADDFLLTGLSTQGDLTRFINEGSTQRKVIISRFMDLDVFDRMHSQAKDELAELRAMMKTLPDVDWTEAKQRLKSEAKQHEAELAACESQVFQHRQRLQELKVEWSKLGSGKASTSEADVRNQSSVCERLQKRVAALTERIAKDERVVKSDAELLQKLLSELERFDLVDLERRHASQRAIEVTLLTMQHDHEREFTLLKAQEKSVKKLLEVPCGDAFPACKFIKDSHADKGRIATQKAKVEKLLEQVSATQAELDVLKSERLAEKIEKLKQLATKTNALRLEIATAETELAQARPELASAMTEEAEQRQRLVTLRDALKHSLSSEEVALKREIDLIEGHLRDTDARRLAAAAAKGRSESALEKLTTEHARYDELHAKLRIHELLMDAFSKRGIPNQIINAQLPAINAAIAKTLHGITDFTVEMQSDVESNAMDVYIDYGDSRRIIELGSGMEKTIASLAIRVALLEVTSLPRSDVFIIDEGFGTLDDQQVEACNRFLLSLKQRFRLTLIVSHVAGIKDVADNVIEIARIEKDSRVRYD